MPREMEDSHGFYDPVAKYMEHFFHDKCLAEFSKGCHDPVARYVEKPHIMNGCIWICDAESKSLITTLCHLVILHYFLSSKRRNCAYGIIYLIGFIESQKLPE